MSKLKMLIAVAVLIGIAITSYVFVPRDTQAQITVFKSPTCDCCGEYISYLKDEGFKVAVQNVQNRSEIKEKYGIPAEMESCHTAVMGNYFIEGHVPVSAINKLITEKPVID
ncbi:MAG: DUF411 domain-containing protein, partial [Patescibacteria group bacterium]